MPACSLFLVALLAALFGCADPRPKAEAAALAHCVDQLRLADNDHKNQPLANLRSLGCTVPDVCAARDACVDAYAHHVRGIELGHTIKKALDQDADSGTDAGPSGPALQQLLLEMNIEIEEGNQRMPLCDQRVTELLLRPKP